MEVKEWIWLLGACSSFIAASIALIAALKNFELTKKAQQWNDESQRSQLFLNLRERYLTTRMRISERVYLKDFVIHKSDESWPHIQQYWYNVFDEWYSTTKLNKGKYEDLWDGYFGPATQSSLKYPAMVTVLDSMLAGAVSFGNEKDNFKQTLQQLNASLEEDQRAVNALFGSAPST
ncbi:MAG: hypothetical protein V7752_19715 [Halopseudomonas sp.]